MDKDFQEVAHSGGKLIFHIARGEEGHKLYQVEYTNSRPVPMVLIELFATRDGLPLGAVPIVGIGQQHPKPPIPDCFPVFVGSDSEGLFGHQCPRCSQYWRSGPWPRMCPYCAFSTDPIRFLSSAQRHYIRHYCDVLAEALDAADVGDVEIDMDAVADAVAHQEKPAFYVAEESQQLRYACSSCGEAHDVLGKYCYCSACATRHDLDLFLQTILPEIRERLKHGGGADQGLSEAVGAFDAFVSQYAKALSANVRMIPARRAYLAERTFLNLLVVRRTFLEWFGFDLCAGLKEDDVLFAARCFYRRHVYVHQGGQVDRQYLEDSGDDTVRLGQTIHENLQDVHTLIGIIRRMAENLHNGFHLILEPYQPAIEAYRRRQTVQSG